MYNVFVCNCVGVRSLQEELWPSFALLFLDTRWTLGNSYSVHPHSSSCGSPSSSSSMLYVRFLIRRQPAVLDPPGSAPRIAGRPLLLLHTTRNLASQTRENACNIHRIRNTTTATCAFERKPHRNLLTTSSSTRT